MNPQNKDIKLVMITLVFIGLLLIGFFIFLFFSSNNKNNKVVDCYDNHNNKIIGAECLEKTDDLSEIILLYIFSLFFMFFFLGILFLKNRSLTREVDY